MKKFVSTLCFIGCILSATYTQTLVDTFPFEPTTQFNSFWGICDIDGVLQIGADGNGDIYKVNANGEITATVDVDASINFNHGLVWDGQSYWTCEDFTSGGASLFQLDGNGNILQSFVLPPVNGGNSSGVGGLTFDGDQLWYSVYYPDFDVYPFSYAYKIDLTTQELTDTIPLLGKQVYGLAAKGDTLFYVTDDLDDDEERIYAYSKTLGDTLYSFPLLDPDGDSSPRGLHWDGNYLWLVAKRPGGAAFAFSMLYQYDIESPFNPSPQMSISEESIDMGMVYLSENSSASFQIYNTGDGDLEVSAISVDNAVFSITQPASLPVNISPGDSTTVTILFEPTALLVYNNILTVTSNSVNDPVQQINLIGEGIELTGTTNQKIFPFRLFPNPADDLVQLEWGTEVQGKLEISIHNINGQKERTFFVAADNSKSTKLETHDLTPGLYLLIIKGFESAIPLLISRN